MRSWLIYIAAFLGGLGAAYLGVRVLAPTMLTLTSEVFSFLGLILSAILPAYAAFVVIYAGAHRWRPSAAVCALGFGVCIAIALLGLLLMYSEVVQLATGIGLMVLAGFVTGRYMTMKYGNG